MTGWRVPLWAELSLVILLALVASNAATFFLAESRRSSDIRAERIGAIEDRLSALVGLLSRLPESERANLLTVASVRRERVSIGTTPRVADHALRESKTEARLKASLGALGPADVRVAKRGQPDLGFWGPRKRGGLERFSVAIALGSRQWLNAEFYWPEGEALLPGLLFSGVVAALALIVVSVWIGWRVSGPLRRLAEASAQMQSGKAVTAIPETGPWVLRGAAKAFNLMSQRLMTLVDNQRVLLASIGHDLRTPITSLRLKSEFIEDEDLKGQFSGSLDELQSLTEAALDAVRNGIGEEAPREVDVCALAESICADLSDLGADVAFATGAPVFAVCRPNEIKRAARNLVENAIKYGERARVSVNGAGQNAAIVVDDDGPGLTAEDMARVFEPFVRLGSPANDNAAGHGLGLTLARAISRAHSGDVYLENRDERGLRATLTLRRMV